VVTDTYPVAVQKSFRGPGIISELAPSVLMEVSQEGAMVTPADGGVGPQPLEDVVVSTRPIYTFAIALIPIALVASVIVYLMIEF
jgi:hypothetical protein